MTPLPCFLSTVPPVSPADGAAVQSLFELIVSGGPLMIPIGLCSIVALGFATERWVRLQPRALGTRAFGREVVGAVRASGVPAAAALCERAHSPLARVLGAGLSRAEAPFLEREKLVEDVAASEVRQLGRNLRPLLLVWLIAPLLGLLGTVWGMIQAFGNIANVQAIGRPELLASGIYTALTTTAAGLAVAIPAIVLHHVLKGRIESFANRCEEHYRELDRELGQRARPRVTPAEPAAAPSAAGAVGA